MLYFQWYFVLHNSYYIYKIGDLEIHTTPTNRAGGNTIRNFCYKLNDGLLVAYNSYSFA